MTRTAQLASLAAWGIDKFASGWRRLSRAVQPLVYHFCVYHYVDENPDYRACVLLAGSGRGGTTWLAEVINYDNSYRFIFEPFKSIRVPSCSMFGECQYLRPDDGDPRFLDPARTIFSGRLRSGWTDAYNRRLRADRRLIKDIRANLLLGWFRAHFPEMPIVLLLRHPCAVANSRCRERWHANLEKTFLSQQALMEDYLEPFRPAFVAARSDFERHVIWWCVENYVPLVQFAPGDILVTTYEQCVASPQTEIARIFQFLRKPFNDNVLRATGKPSSTTRFNRRSRNASPIVSGEGLLDAWQRSVDRSDAERAEEILKLFGLDAIYGLDPMPKSKSIENFMRAAKGGSVTPRKQLD